MLSYWVCLVFAHTQTESSMPRRGPATERSDTFSRGLLVRCPIYCDNFVCVTTATARCAMCSLATRHHIIILASHVAIYPLPPPSHQRTTLRQGPQVLYALTTSRPFGMNVSTAASTELSTPKADLHHSRFHIYTNPDLTTRYSNPDLTIGWTITYDRCNEQQGVSGQRTTHCHSQGGNSTSQHPYCPNQFLIDLI